VNDTQHTQLRKVKDLVEGDLVDLEGDKYVDPEHDEFSSLFYEFATVQEVEFETPSCVVVHFDAVSCGFPPEHEVPVVVDEWAAFVK